mmetsp:Transcript_60176/g.68533  ORF Transcript_60176/g.68533 Transcript_60176/m.68533 type:complete len:244 (-) Transcript_60176:1288-2019(-)
MFLLEVFTFVPFVTGLLLEHLLEFLDGFFQLSERSLLELPGRSNSAPPGEQNVHVSVGVLDQLHLVEQVFTVMAVLNINLGHDGVVSVGLGVFFVNNLMDFGETTFSIRLDLLFLWLSLLLGTLLQLLDICLAITVDVIGTISPIFHWNRSMSSLEGALDILCTQFLQSLGHDLRFLLLSVEHGDFAGLVFFVEREFVAGQTLEDLNIFERTESTRVDDVMNSSFSVVINNILSDLRTLEQKF